MDSIVLSAEYAEGISHKASHFHDCHQLIYMTQGQIRITVSGKEYLATPGMMILISRFEQHSIQVESTQYCRYTLRISPNLSDWSTLPSDPLLSLLVNRPESFQHAVNLCNLPNVEPIIQQIVTEAKKQDSFHEKMLEMLLLQLLILVYRSHPKMLPDEESNLCLIRQIQQQFESHYAEDYTLHSLSLQYHVSASHLSHLFKQVTGTSVMGYLISCRFAAAKRYLAETNLEISKIVELCGFSDTSNFSRSFKGTTGLTPTDFRTRFQQHS